MRLAGRLGARLTTDIDLNWVVLAEELIDVFDKLNRFRPTNNQDNSPTAENNIFPS